MPGTIVTGPPSIPTLAALAQTLFVLPSPPTTADLAAIALAAGQVGPLVAAAASAMPILSTKGYDTALTAAAAQLASDAAAATPASYAAVSNDIPLVKLAFTRFVAAAYAQQIANDIASSGCATLNPTNIRAFQAAVDIINGSTAPMNGQYDTDTAGAASALIGTNAAAACTGATGLPIVTLPVTTTPPVTVTPVSTTTSTTSSTTNGIPTSVFVGGAVIGLGAIALLAIKMSEAKTVAAAAPVARKRR